MIVLKRFREWLDWKIYCYSYKAINRHLQRSAGHTYLAYLYTKEATERNPPSEELKKATELFYTSMKDFKYGG